jgi:hypothetical protein
MVVTAGLKKIPHVIFTQILCSLAYQVLFSCHSPFFLNLKTMESVMVVAVYLKKKKNNKSTHIVLAQT